MEPRDGEIDTACVCHAGRPRVSSTPGARRLQHLPYRSRPLRSPSAIVLGTVSRVRLASSRCAGWCRISLHSFGCDRRQPKAIRQRSHFNSSAFADGPVLRINARSGPQSRLAPSVSQSRTDGTQPRTRRNCSWNRYGTCRLETASDTLAKPSFAVLTLTPHQMAERSCGAALPMRS